VEAKFSAPALRPTQPPVKWVKGFPGSKVRPRLDADLSSPSNAVGHERVELYFYSPYGPYGLYKASVPVQGCNLPLDLIKRTINRNIFLHKIF